MFGFLFVLILQGGSPAEPPSAHRLHAAEPLPLVQQGAEAEEAARIEIYARNLPSLVQVRLAASDAATPVDAVASEFVLSGVVLAEVEGGALVVVPGKWQGERAASLAIYDMAGRRYPAEGREVAPQLGLSLLAVDGLLVEAPLFGFADPLPIGSQIALIGNGYGLYGSLSMGILSGRSRQLDELAGLLQVTNPVHPGDGGGLVLDRQGRLVGIALTSLEDALRRKNSATPGLAGAGRPTGISFVMPIHQVLEAFEETLQLPAAAPRPIMGVQVQEAPIPRDLRRSLGLEQRTALLVGRVEPGLPAAQAGLQSGGYLVGIGGRPVRSFACLFSWIRSAGDRALVQFVRGDELLEREVKVLRKPRGENGAPAKPGFSTQASPALIDDRD